MSCTSAYGLQNRARKPPSLKRGMNGPVPWLERMALCYTRCMRKRTTIWLDEADRAAVATVRERYGVATDSDAIRLALRLLAESARVRVEPASNKRDSQP
jgi:Arc/MetJ family transcription regulator